MSRNNGILEHKFSVDIPVSAIEMVTPTIRLARENDVPDHALMEIEVGTGLGRVVTFTWREES